MKQASLRALVKGIREAGSVAALRTEIKRINKSIGKISSFF